MNNSSMLMALRLADSFLPVGTYTSSYGVEQYVTNGRIQSAEELGDLVAAYLERLVGPADLVALGNAHEATIEGDDNRLFTVDERLHAATLPAEFRESSQKAGQQLLEVFRASDSDLSSGLETYQEAVGVDTPGHFPVVLGIVSAWSGIPRYEACLLKSYSFATELLGAAQRLGCFGHTEIQTQLVRLFPVITAVCKRYGDAPLSRLSSFAPLAEIMSMSHERAQRRLFMS